MKRDRIKMVLSIACCAAAVCFFTAGASADLTCSGRAMHEAPPMAQEGRILQGYNLVWSENTGWVNLLARHADLRIGSNILAGWIWLENCGWVHVGDATPGDGKRYSNRSVRDWGVNNDGCGRLSGYAWSEATGWINFSSAHSRVYLDEAGRFCGYAWGENVGWVHFGPGGAVNYLAKADPGPWKEIGTEVGGRLAGNGGAGETFAGGGSVPVSGLSRGSERYDGNAGILCLRTVDSDALSGYARAFEKPVYLHQAEGCSYIRGPPPAAPE